MPENSVLISPDVLVFVFTCFYLCQLCHYLYLSLRVLSSKYYTGIITGIQGLTWVLQILVMPPSFPNIRACISIFWVPTDTLPSSPITLDVVRLQCVLFSCKGFFFHLFSNFTHFLVVCSFFLLYLKVVSTLIRKNVLNVLFGTFLAFLPWLITKMIFPLQFYILSSSTNIWDHKMRRYLISDDGDHFWSQNFFCLFFPKQTDFFI